ncbi:MAG: hypothetical protein R8G66_15675 [Cytophagales bacterium]|nr:hypothetical protein [Cytophagales bacterium]
MVKSGKFLLLLIGFIWACSEDFSSQLYDYQVERLLTGGDQATWSPTSILLNGDQLLNDCADSVLFMFELNTDDSLSLRRLRPNCPGGTLYDTLGIEKGNASVDEQIFTDSIRFSDGGFFLINSVFSQSLEIQSGDTILRFRRFSTD